MSDIVIRAENLGKKYIIGHQAESGSKGYTALRDVIIQNAQGFWYKTRDLIQGKAIIQGDMFEEVWALRDVNFEIRQGEAVGIIGRNGAGKSTLLKILSRITEPSTGRVTIQGRVASLLEVGTGFHPELTGRENIYLNGAILGMKRHEIKRKFDEIVAFAEVERYLDTPVKRYSSGMYVRLAFAVAAHLEPEILVVDEVLAVGDAAFQKKCLGKMGDVAGEGRTVLFVSHNMAAVKALCSYGILLENGKVVLNGAMENIVSHYLNDHTSSIDRSRVFSKPIHDDVPAYISSIQLVTDKGDILSQPTTSESFCVEIEYEVLQSQTVLNLSLSIYTHDDMYVLASPSLTDEVWYQEPHEPGVYNAKCFFPGDFFNKGQYFFTVLLVQNGRHQVQKLDRIVRLEFVDDEQKLGGYYGFWGGAVRPILDWKTERIGENTNSLPKLEKHL